MSSASASWEPIFRRGLSDEYGFWKTSWSRASSRGRPRRAERRDLAALEDDGSRRRADEPDRGARERRLAAARLADEADDLAALDAEARAGDRAHAAAAAALVVDDDVRELERAHRAANGSTGQASARPFDGDELRARATRQSSLRERAARVERAAGRDAAGARRRARDRDERLVLSELRVRQRVEQRARVRVARAAEDVLARARLDHAAGVEDRDAVGDRRHDAEVVRDQDHREVVLAAEAVEQPEDPGLHGDVERRRRLVGDQQLRPAGEGDRDRDPLAHPARELVRVGAQGLAAVRDAHLLEQLERAALGGAAVEAEVEPHVLGQLPPDREHRVERRHRVLEDHREVAPGELAQPRGAAGASRSRPSKRTRPSTTAPSGSRPSSASIDIVLPLPLSPATPNTSPCSTR